MVVHTDLDYRPAGTNNGKQLLDLHIPTGTAPSDGWPIWIHYQLGGFTGSVKEGLDGLDQAALAAGFAVASVEVTVTDQGTIPGYNPPGGGMFWQVDATDFSYDGDADDTPVSDGVWVVEFLRSEAATYDLNPDKVIVYGRSAGSSLAQWCAWMPDAADLSSGLPAMRAESSRVQGAVLLTPQTHFKAFKTLSPPETFYHRKASDTTTWAVDGSLAVAQDILESSGGYFLMDAAQFDANSIVPIYLRAGVNLPGNGALGTVSYALDANLRPTMAGTTTTGLVDIHDAWHCAILYKQLLAMSPFHESRSVLSAPTAWTVDSTITPTHVGSTADWITHTITWALQTLDEVVVDVGGVATLNLRMDWRSDVQVHAGTIQTPRSGGMVQRRQAATAVSRWSGKRSLRKWTINWRDASRGEHDLVYATWRAAHGGSRGINFVPPNGPAVLARFVGGSFRSRQSGPYRFAMSVELEEMP